MVWQLIGIYRISSADYRTKAEFYADMATRESTAKQLIAFVFALFAILDCEPIEGTTSHQEFQPYKDQLQHFLSYKLPLRCLQPGP
ncbi:hypothetical protein P8452_12969 [Trifolium repens]|jgi:hypothetical protein|nr:hypothetical protein P8452_12969 [Trifolium repens]